MIKSREKKNSWLLFLTLGNSFFHHYETPITNIMNPNPFSIYIKKTVVCQLPWKFSPSLSLYILHIYMAGEHNYEHLCHSFFFISLRYDNGVLMKKRLEEMKTISVWILTKEKNNRMCEIRKCYTILPIRIDWQKMYGCMPSSDVCIQANIDTWGCVYCSNSHQS